VRRVILPTKPDGFYEAFKWALHSKVPIIVTENGVEDAEDKMRPRYIAQHIHQMWRAVQFQLAHQRNIFIGRWWITSNGNAAGACASDSGSGCGYAEKNQTSLRGPVCGHLQRERTLVRDGAEVLS